jgi:plastocyanin/FtsP/CotA-like multicopper oxidase with cupredoxin domain
MATIEYWIQLENRPWDASPHNIDRMHGEDIEHTLGAQGAPPIEVTLTSPETGVVKNRKMYFPVNDGTKDGAGGKKEWRVKDALILRHYTANWAAPDDRKVNPWDLNESDPTDNGTMGTIPGPTLECNVGDKIVVHFRNKDFRKKGEDKTVTIPLPFPPFKITIKIPAPFLPESTRAHSLHPHGIAFAPHYDGAFPLSPADSTQPIPPDEEATWESVGVKNFKKGDRVPPGGTFTYTWDTFGWPATAGVWHYHDHSVCDAENVLLGARGFLIIHNTNDPDDVIDQDLPQGEHNGKLIRHRCIPFPVAEPPLLAGVNLEGLQIVRSHDIEGGMIHAAEKTGTAPPGHSKHDKAKGSKKPADEVEPERGFESEFALASGPFLFELSEDLKIIRAICFPRYINPPGKQRILQYYAELPGIDMTINGRRFLGNTPTIISGIDTKMRFGLAAMNNITFHTFHLHGHRWVIPGPQGTDPNTIQNSPQIQAVSQFEDTKIFGPANSFSFTINQGSFMGSRFTPDPAKAPGLGEWHMHCHVLHHMMPGGMMGSLLVVQGGQLALPLAKGMPCHPDEDMKNGDHGNGHGGEQVVQVNIENAGDDGFVPKNLIINVGDSVRWKNNDAAPHTASKTSGPGPNFDTGNIAPGATSAPIVFNTAGTMNYRCNIHPNMTATIQVNP